MRIVFDLCNVGLGNNGGSRTLLKCGEILAQLGVEVIFFSNVKSNYTWHRPISVKFLQGETAPRCDVIIATGYKSVAHTTKSKATRKLYYIRGFELWQANEEQLLQSYKSLSCIVNSEWLFSFLRRKNIHSKIIYPGLDFDSFQNFNQKRESVFGAIFSERHRTKRYEDAVEVAKITGYRLLSLNKDIQKASDTKLNDWYNKIKVWFAPSELEGLHNPPMEAALCGCALVCTNAEKSGTGDFAIHGKTALVYPQRDLKMAAKYVFDLIKDDNKRVELNKNMVVLLRKKIGTRKENMEKLIKYIA